MVLNIKREQQALGSHGVRSESLQWILLDLELVLKRRRKLRVIPSLMVHGGMR